jgi:hypothetical protein
MSLAAQTDFFTPTPDYRIVAAKRFPLSGAVGNIRGDGCYCAVTRCFKRWKIFLYRSDSDRAAKLHEWEERGCCPDCRLEHSSVDLTL